MPRSKDPYSYLRGDESASDSDLDDSEDEFSSSEESGMDLAFEDKGVGEKLRHFSEEDLDTAPFGIIRVDDEGIVQFYNRTESELSGIAPSEAVGTNFFTKLAPCSNNPLFLGRFKEGIEEGELDEHFTYTFTYKMRPTLVDVRLYRDQAGNNWMMIRER